MTVGLVGQFHSDLAVDPNFDMMYVISLPGSRALNLTVTERRKDKHRDTDRELGLGDLGFQMEKPQQTGHPVVYYMQLN